MTEQENRDKPKIVYRTEYILKLAQILRRDDAEKLRNDFIEGIKTGVAIAPPNFEVEAHQQPVCIIMPDGKIIYLEALHV